MSRRLDVATDLLHIQRDLALLLRHLVDCCSYGIAIWATDVPCHTVHPVVPHEGHQEVHGVDEGVLDVTGVELMVEEGLPSVFGTVLGKL